MSVVVNTPTGNIGSILTNKLLSVGEKVTIIARDATKVQSFKDRGATIIVGSMDDPQVLTDSMKGAKSLIWLTPPISGANYAEWSIAAAKIAASTAKTSNVNQVIVISSMGAQVGKGTGIISYLKDVEDEFKSVLKNVVVLRPGFFFENLVRDIVTVAKEGTVYSAFQPDLKAPQVSILDIANKILCHILCPSNGQFTIGIHGTKDLSVNEAWKIIGKEIGKEIKVISLKTEDLKKTLLDSQVPLFQVNATIDFIDRFNDGTLCCVETRSLETTTPTSLIEWAQTTFKQAFNAHQQ